MKIVKPSWRYLDVPDGHKILNIIEAAGKLCYQSLEDKKSTAEEFAKKAIRLGHLSVIEHASVGVVVVTDRGVTHEAVRHRLASYSQESTRYCNYSQDKFGNEITYIDPYCFELNDRDKEVLKIIEDHYLECVKENEGGKSRLVAQQARYFLPNGLKTEIAITCNIREWRHIFTLRTSGKAHPDIRGIMLEILRDFKLRIPVLFDDILEKDVQ